MDGNTFDRFAQKFAVAQSRRSFLKGVVGSALALGLGSRRSGESNAASCRRTGEICREHANCCTRTCGAKDRTGRRVCVCPSGTVDCGGACVNPGSFSSDPNNCGACGNTCHPRTPCETVTCVNGACHYTPKPNDTACINPNRHCNPGACTAGVCIDGPPLVCPLTNDKCAQVSCYQDVGCVTYPKPCDDGKPCTIDTCNPATGSCINTPIVCPNGGTCNQQTGVCEAAG